MASTAASSPDPAPATQSPHVRHRLASDPPSTAHPFYVWVTRELQRRRRGESLASLARAMGTNDTMFTRWRSGAGGPTINTVRGVCQALGMWPQEMTRLLVIAELLVEEEASLQRPVPDLNLITHDELMELIDTRMKHGFQRLEPVLDSKHNSAHTTHLSGPT